MSNFKIGDKIVCVDDSACIYISRGDKFEACEPEYKPAQKDMVCIQVNVLGANRKMTYAADRFKLAEPEFDMFEEPWFIQYNNGQEYDIAVEFVKSRGFVFAYEANYDNSKVITNRSGYAALGVFGGKHLVIRSDYTTNRKEIVLKYKTTLDQVIYPKVKSAVDIEAENLEREIRILTDRLNNLKGKTNE